MRLPAAVASAEVRKRTFWLTLKFRPMNKLQLVVFDLAGTTVDFGSLAPLAAFEGAFAKHGVKVSRDEIRPFMGLHKRDHIRNMLQVGAIAERWRGVHGKDWTGSDAEAIYQSFIPLQLTVLPDYGAVVPGLLEVVAALRQRGMRTGATTGYSTIVTGSAGYFNVTALQADCETMLSSITVNYSGTTTPEPGGLILAGCALIGIGLIGKRKKKA